MRTALIFMIALLAVVVLGPVGGCASMLSMIDTQEALAVTDQTNVANWTKVRDVQVAFYNGELRTLDLGAANRFVESAGGEEAVGIFGEYLLVREALENRRAAAQHEYTEALDNAVLAQELRDRQAALISGWWGLFRKLPGVETLRAVAEVKAREIVAADQ